MGVWIDGASMSKSEDSDMGGSMVKELFDRIVEINGLLGYIYLFHIVVFVVVAFGLVRFFGLASPQESYSLSPSTIVGQIDPLK